jgi:hypothetical protein
MPMEMHEPASVPWRVVGRESLLMVVILGIFFVSAMIVTMAILGPKQGLLGGLVAFCLMSFIGLPLWLASLEDDLAEH